MFKISLITFVIFLMSASSVLAQSNSSWMNLMQQTVNNSWTCEAIKRAAEKSGKPLPEQCAYLNSGSAVSKGSSSPSSKTGTASNAAGVTAKFTPAAGAESFEQIAASISDVPQEKQLIAQTAAVMKSTMEEEYGTRGWKNNVAGAVAFFTTSMLTVYYDKEPSEAVQNAIFDSYNSAPEFASASNKDKQSLYNALLAYSGMPMLFYIKGKQEGNDGIVQQAKALAKHNLKTLLKADPESLAPLLQGDSPGRSEKAPASASTVDTRATASSGDARYSTDLRQNESAKFGDMQCYRQ